MQHAIWLAEQDQMTGFVRKSALRRFHDLEKSMEPGENIIFARKKIQHITKICYTKSCRFYGLETDIGICIKMTK